MAKPQSHRSDPAPDDMRVRRRDNTSDAVKILIVDDEPKNLTVLETVLGDAGYTLVRAGSGDDALLALLDHEFAALVLDVSMPGMTGFELAHLIRRRKKTAAVPIIFLTAHYNEDRHVLEGYGSGAVDYLHKPVDAVVLRAKVGVFAELYRKGNALEMANRALVNEVTERRLAEARLLELNDTLDRRVNERTDALRASEALLRDADRRKDEFLATLAHELRNPLAPVRNAARVLRLKGAATPELAPMVELIERQVRTMGHLIDDLMDVSRINQGKIELRRQPVDMADVVHEALQTIRPLIDDCRHEVVLNLESGQLVLLADRTRLGQALTNLLINAAKYMEPGGRIEVAVRSSADTIHVAIADSGIGIPPDRLESVFEMFSQVETARTRSRGGLGIGLSLTRRLVQLHGGSVVARSAGLGLGSVFEVSLPRMPDPPPNAPATVAPAASRTRSLRVLVADDNQDHAAALRAMLEALGHEVCCVHDGLAAVQAACEFRPDFALLDIGMPLLDGHSACARIRALPDGAAITMLAITGWGQPEDQRAALEAGFDEHLVKPVDPLQIERLLAAPARLRDTR